MANRFIRTTAAIAGVAVTAGCGLTGEEPREPSQRSGSITIGDTSKQTQSVTCTQNEWLLIIRAHADPGNARVFLTLGGQTPVVDAVAIENIDGLGGVSGGDVGKAEATIDGSAVYRITGTATATDSTRPGQTTDMPFRIEAPC